MNELQEYTTSEQRLFQRASQKRLPISGSLELLPLCNLNCRMCYVRLSRQEMEQQGRIRTASEWLKIAEELRQEGVLFLMLTGGEPFLYPEFEKLYSSLKKMGFILTINTNGTMITSEHAAYLGRLMPRRVNVTLYGASSDTYERLCGSGAAYDQAMGGIKLLTEQGVPVKINFSATKENMHDLNEILRFGREMNLPVSVDSYMQQSKRERSHDFDSAVRLSPQEAAESTFLSMQYKMGEEAFPIYVDHILDKIAEAASTAGSNQHTAMRCIAGKCSFSINWQGQLRPCSILSSPSVSVFEHGFSDSWNTLTGLAESINLNAACSSCKYRIICRTCAAAALYETGEYDGIPEYMCQYADALYQLYSEFVHRSE